MFELSSQDFRAMTAFLQDLVRMPSLSTQEGEVAARLADEMRRVGIADVRVDRIGNVIGRVGAGRGKKLLLNGHMDTVGAGDLAAWRRDPFGAEVEDGVLYGRGAADMKGALAAMVYAAKRLLEARASLSGDLYLVGVVQEEPCEGLAMQVVVEEGGLRPDWVVLCEPSDLQVRRGQRGRMEMQVTVEGKACHASAPHLGENAIYGAAQVIFGLELLAGQLASDRLLGQGSLAVTQIESTAGSRNAVPDRCAFYIDRRLTLGETEAKALAEVQGVILREDLRARVEVTEYQAMSYTGYQVCQRAYFPAWAMEEDHPLVQAMARSVRKTLGYYPHIGQWAFSTDGVYTMGKASIPTVGFGPGEERYAHTVEEQIRLEDVAAAARVYAQLAVDLLG
ncbi:MAG: YgeY family selenium metabolism-linked hydrolase [Anaerolineae bacterium]|nr:MAG: YgeY family selenium metabolism-linked hydrolase [Anaerolineae bacterium]